MAQQAAALLAAIGEALNALPDVFSTVQWGGRAYKIPGPGGNRHKPKLLAHVYPCKDGQTVGVTFKLPTEKAHSLTEDLDWITPHSFKSLARSGWIEARVRSKAHLKPLSKMLLESRALHPVHERGAAASAAAKEPAPGGATGGDVSRRIAQVLAQTEWTPDRDDGFDDAKPRQSVAGRAKPGRRDGGASPRR